jgi:hypothetical protein
MSEPVLPAAGAMNRHRVILGWLFFAVAVLISVAVVFTLRNYFGNADTPQAGHIVKVALLVAALFALSGLSLLIDFRYAAWICLPFSVLILFSFPIGTLLGAYYGWYHWRRFYARKAQ